MIASEPVYSPPRERLWVVYALLALAALLLYAPTIHAAPLNGELGDTFIELFAHNETGGASQNFGVVQAKNDLIYAANLMTVLEYDGERWRRIPHPKQLRPLSIDTDERGQVFLGFQNDFGFLQPNPDGRMHVVSLQEAMPENLRPTGYIWAVKATREGVYFRSPHRLYRWQGGDESPLDGRVNVWSFPPENRLLGLDAVNGHCYFWQENVGLMRVEGDSCRLAPAGELAANLPVRSVTAFQGDTLLLTCEDRGLFLYDGEEITPFQAPANEYARSSFATNCTRAPMGRFLLATRHGGLLLFDRQGNILRIIDQKAGLPVAGVIGKPYIDRQLGVWLPLNFGLARTEVLSPLDVFDYSQGLQGAVYAIERYRGTLYVSTSRGLMHLLPSSNRGRPASFAPLPGTSGQHWDLLRARGHLYSAAPEGLLQIQSPTTSPELIHPQRMGYCLAATPGEEHLYMGTYNEGLHAFDWQKEGWRYEGRVPGTASQILDLATTSSGEVWLMADYQHVERVTVRRDPAGVEERYQVARYDTADGLPRMGYYSPLVLNGDFFVGNVDGLFRFSREQNRFVPDPILGRKFSEGGLGIWNMIQDSSGTVWFNSQYSKGGQATPGDSGEYELNYPLLRASRSNFLCFYPENEGHTLWAGSEDGRVIRYDDRYDLSDSTSFPIHIRRVVAGEDSVLLDGGVPDLEQPPRLPFSMNSLRILYALPRYDAPEANKYRYRLVGLNDQWSDWSSENYRDFNSLREGRYSFQVQGYDVYYLKSNTASFDFIVLPPWYRTVWAYLLYAVAGVGGLFGLFKWRVRRIEAQKEQLEQVVEERTRELASAHDQIKQHNEQLETTLKERTRHLLFSERQAAFGQLVQGIVHNLKNPLTSSSMAVDMALIHMARLRRPEGEEAGTEELKKTITNMKDSFDVISRANESLNNMIMSLLAKSRSDREEDRRPTDLNEIVRQEMEFLMADSRFKHKVKRHAHLASELLVVDVVPGEMSQVVQNLIRNALDALHNHPNPEITIETRGEEKEVLLIVEDNGPGIPEEIQDKIFDPFFTTKPVNTTSQSDDQPRGTGLGLWMCRQSTESFHGAIELTSNLSVGTRFTVRLPRLANRELLGTF